MAKASYMKSYTIGSVTKYTSIDFKGSEKFCHEGVVKVIDKLSRSEDETPNNTQGEAATNIALFSNNGETESPVSAHSQASPCPPCATPAPQPPIYDVTLKDGEEIQIMEIGTFTVANIITGKCEKLVQYILVDCLKDEYRMNPTETTEGGWDACELRKKLNGEILDRFPDELRTEMVPFENGDLLRLPTREEIFGDKDGNRQFECMKRRGNRVASQGKNGPWEYYWLSSVANSTDFCTVTGNGIVSDSGASNVAGVRPRFQLRVRSES